MSEVISSFTRLPLFRHSPRLQTVLYEEVEYEEVHDCKSRSSTVDLLYQTKWPMGGQLPVASQASFTACEPSPRAATLSRFLQTVGVPGFAEVRIWEMPRPFVLSARLVRNSRTRLMRAAGHCCAVHTRRLNSNFRTARTLLLHACTTITIIILCFSRQPFVVSYVSELPSNRPRGQQFAISSLGYQSRYHAYLL
jgi:hypothetical protein